MTFLREVISRRINQYMFRCLRINSKLNGNNLHYKRTHIIIPETGRRFFNRSSYHLCSTHSCQRQGVVDIFEYGIRLTIGDYKLDLPFLWLRDNCRCEKCLNPETFQRNVEANPLFPTPSAKDVIYNNDVLTVIWNDNHATCYDSDWLLENSYHGYHKDIVNKVLWNKDTLTNHPLPVVGYEEYMSTNDGLKKHLTNMLQFGFSMVTGVQPNHDGTLEVSRRICHIMETFYGQSWQFTTKMEFKDTAYTDLALGAHTDNTYFFSPAGVQVFHVVKHIGEGGQTLLVDGFHAAENLRRSSPDSFGCLVKAVVPHEYVDEHRRVRSLGTVLSLHPTTGQLLSIRYNTYDRAPLYTLDPNDAIRFYESYNKLGKEITNPSNEFWVKLTPDMVLFVDNWRVLHGRSAFTGSRHVSGCYLPYDDWTARARSFGLINL